MKESKAGQPMTFKTVDELEEKVESFFTSDDAFIINYKEGEEERIYAPTVSGLALHLGVDRRTSKLLKQRGIFSHHKKSQGQNRSPFREKAFRKQCHRLDFQLKK